MTYYAESIGVGRFVMGGGLFSANGNGTVTYTPIRGFPASGEVRDLQTKRQVTVSKFAADRIPAWDVKGLLRKKR